MAFRYREVIVFFLEYIMLLVFEPELEKSYKKISLDINS